MAVPNLAIFHGIASTLLNEIGFHPDWIERQLAHDERNKIRAAYNHAQYLPERRRMMQQWKDCLDDLEGRGGSDTAARLHGLKVLAEGARAKFSKLLRSLLPIVPKEIRGSCWPS